MKKLQRGGVYGLSVVGPPLSDTAGIRITTPVRTHFLYPQCTRTHTNTRIHTQTRTCTYTNTSKEAKIRLTESVGDAVGTATRLDGRAWRRTGTAMRMRAHTWAAVNMGAGLFVSLSFEVEGEIRGRASSG